MSVNIEYGAIGENLKTIDQIKQEEYIRGYTQGAADMGRRFRMIFRIRLWWIFGKLKKLYLKLFEDSIEDALIVNQALQHLTGCCDFCPDWVDCRGKKAKNKLECYGRARAALKKEAMAGRVEG